MPPITPTRALFVLTTFLLVCFLWTWGLPREYTPPQLPVAKDDATKKPLGSQVLPEPLVDDAGRKPVPSTPGNESATPSSTADVRPGLDCKSVRGASSIMIIVRTSTHSTPSSLPAPLKSLLACTPHVLVFSDRPGTLSGYPLHDALASLSPATKAAHPDFHAYAPSSPSHVPTPDQASRLAKWTYLPTIYQTATLAPSHRFYLFLDPSTTLTWTNLLQWLARLDARIPYYIGAPAEHAETKYARAAPAILLSYAAMQHFRTAYDDFYNGTWESQVTSSTASGDVVLAAAMKDARVEFYAAAGLLETDGLADMEWRKERWCTPVVGWAGLGAGEREAVEKASSAWTDEKGWDVPWTQGRAFGALVETHVEEIKEGWDNRAEDTVLKAVGDRKGEGMSELGTFFLPSVYVLLAFSLLCLVRFANSFFFLVLQNSPPKPLPTARRPAKPTPRVSSGSIARARATWARSCVLARGPALRSGRVGGSWSG